MKPTNLHPFDLQPTLSFDTFINNFFNSWTPAVSFIQSRFVSFTRNSLNSEVFYFRILFGFPSLWTLFGSILNTLFRFLNLLLLVFLISSDWISDSRVHLLLPKIVRWLSFWFPDWPFSFSGSCNVLAVSISISLGNFTVLLELIALKSFESHNRWGSCWRMPRHLHYDVGSTL